nr:cysteine hydrolase [Nitrosomonas nitrosa]
MNNNQIFFQTAVTLIGAETALLLTDPQNDFLSDNGVAWPVVGPGVLKNDVRANLERLAKTAKAAGIAMFVSPHYYFTTDKGTRFGGALETFMQRSNMFYRAKSTSDSVSPDSGADWFSALKTYIEDGETVITSPHKVFGPETNDLVYQLRKRDIKNVVLAGMAANLCVESHLRELIEQGFRVIVVKDATASCEMEEGDAYTAALVNFRLIANAVWTTEQAVEELSKLE